MLQQVILAVEQHGVLFPKRDRWPVLEVAAVYWTQGAAGAPHP